MQLRSSSSSQRRGPTARQRLTVGTPELINVARPMADLHAWGTPALYQEVGTSLQVNAGLVRIRHRDPYKWPVERYDSILWQEAGENLEYRGLGGWEAWEPLEPYLPYRNEIRPLRLPQLSRLLPTTCQRSLHLARSAPGNKHEVAFTEVGVARAAPSRGPAVLGPQYVPPCLARGPLLTLS